MSSKNRLKKLVLPSRVNKKVENTHLKQTITKALEKEEAHVDGGTKKKDALYKKKKN